MKKNCWLIFGAMLSTSVLAQPSNPPPSELIQTPAPQTAVPITAVVTNIAAPAPAKKKAAAPAKAVAKAPKKGGAVAAPITTPLVPGPATVDAENVNLRGQAGLKGEVVGHVTKGELVTVLEEVVLNNSEPTEPSAWAKILLPTNTPVWVSAAYIDATSMTVKATRLRLRSGAGENYSILGELKKGDAVKEVSAKNGWLEIETPTNACAFLAAQYLKQEPVGTVTPVEVATTTPPEETAVVENPTLAAPPTETTPEFSSLGAPPVDLSTNVESSVLETNVPAEEPPLKRIVDREGIVRGTISIQAPTRYELFSPETGRTMDYLFTTSVALDLGRWKGMRILVTGEEGLDERWPNTPVLTVQKIHTVGAGAEAP
jgi:uncharacterized protein YgiM (DUF1202 family)